MKRIALTAALCLAVLPRVAQAVDDPYAQKLNAFILGSRDTYAQVRNWQALTESEREAALRGTKNALSSMPVPQTHTAQPESVQPCSDMATAHLRIVCTRYETETLLTAHRKTDPEYVRGQFAMLKMINACQAPGIICGSIPYQVPFGR